MNQCLLNNLLLYYTNWNTKLKNAPLLVKGFASAFQTVIPKVLSMEANTTRIITVYWIVNAIGKHITSDEPFVTDDNGEITVEGLSIGTYTISEVKDKASEGYLLPPDQTITVKTGETVTLMFRNKKIPDVPKTGDESNATLWGTMALAALTGAA